MSGAGALVRHSARGLGPDPAAEAFNRPDDFDRATSERIFSLAMTDIGEIVFLPRLLEYLVREAPGVRLSMVRSHNEDLKREMENGRIDLALGLIPQLGAGFTSGACSCSALSA